MDSPIKSLTVTEKKFLAKNVSPVQLHWPTKKWIFSKALFFICLFELMSVISCTSSYVPRAEHKLDDDSWPNPHIQLPSKYPDRAVPELEINPLVEHHHIIRSQPTEFDFSESDEYKDRTYHHRQHRTVAFERENVAKRPKKKTREAPKVESEVLTIKHTPVGALFTLLVASPINVIDPENFPTWLRFNQSSGEIRTRIGFEVYGIAQPADIGVHSLKVGSEFDLSFQATIRSESL